MPNFQTKQITPLTLPYSQDGVEFLYKGTSVRDEELIFTRYKNEEFFLKQLQREDDILIKGDKLAKPSRVKLLQNALCVYEKAIDAKSIFSNIHTTKNRHEKQNDILKGIDFFAKDFNTFRQKWKNCCVEIGFGSGRHLLYQAKNSPDTLFVGVEIHKPSIEQVVKLCEAQRIENIIIVDFDARVLMEFFASNMLATIFIHFPIPWDKKPHRRVISPTFLREASRLLKNEGTIQLRTDSEKFYRYALEVMSEPPHANIHINKNQDIKVSSKYEDRWKKLDKNIYDVTYINHEISSEKKALEALTFEDEVEGNFFKRETLVYDEFFIHFEENYTINENDFLWRVAFGDSAKVEHCYIEVRDKKARYFPKNIYSTTQNQKAHELIKKRIYNG